MNSLDIDSASTNFSAYRSHQIIIEFTGGSHKGAMRGGTTHTVAVPYSCLSQKLQTIHRLGGKITNVTISNLQLDSSFNVLKVSEEIPAIAPIIEAPVQSAVEINIPTAPEIEFAAPLSTSKKPKSSTKSGQGFNKPKNDIQATRSTRKPKS